MSDADRKSGTVKKIVEGKPFGFISPSDGSGDVFFHQTGLQQGITLADLKEGTAVTYIVEAAEKGPRAIDVMIA